MILQYLHAISIWPVVENCSEEVDVCFFHRLLMHKVIRHERYSISYGVGYWRAIRGDVCRVLDNE